AHSGDLRLDVLPYPLSPAAYRLRHAQVDERAAIAPRPRIARGRRRARFQDGPRPPDGHERRGPQLARDIEVRPPVRREIVEVGPSRRRSRHLLDAERLGAELHAVPVLLLVLAALELYGHRLGYATLALEIELHQIGLADEPVLERADRHPVLLPEESPRLVMFCVHALVQYLPLGGEAVLFPDLLDMDQRELALAEEHMLQARDRQK